MGREGEGERDSKRAYLSARSCEGVSEDRERGEVVVSAVEEGGCLQRCSKDGRCVIG